MGQIIKGAVKQIEGLQLVAYGNTGHAVLMDQKEEVGGFDQAPSPMEFILFGLAGCTAMDVISILQKKRENVKRVEVHFEAERAEDHPKVYKKIHLKYVIKGKNVNPKSVERAIELSETKYCSASAMLSKTAEITHEYVIVEEE